MQLGMMLEGEYGIVGIVFGDPLADQMLQDETDFLECFRRLMNHQLYQKKGQVVTT